MTLIFLKHQAIIWYWEQHVYDSEIKGAAPGTFKGGRGSFIALTSRGNSHPRSDVLQSDLRDAVKESCLTERACCLQPQPLPLVWTPVSGLHWLSQAQKTAVSRVLRAMSACNWTTCHKMVSISLPSPWLYWDAAQMIQVVVLWNMSLTHFLFKISILVLPNQPASSGRPTRWEALLNRLSFPLRGSVIPVAFVEKPSGPVPDRGWVDSSQAAEVVSSTGEGDWPGRQKTNTGHHSSGTPLGYQGAMCSSFLRLVTI